MHLNYGWEGMQWHCSDNLSQTRQAWCQEGTGKKKDFKTYTAVPLVRVTNNLTKYTRQTV